MEDRDNSESGPVTVRDIITFGAIGAAGLKVAKSCLSCIYHCVYIRSLGPERAIWVCDSMLLVIFVNTLRLFMILASQVCLSLRSAEAEKPGLKKRAGMMLGAGLFLHLLWAIYKSFPNRKCLALVTIFAVSLSEVCRRRYRTLLEHEETFFRNGLLTMSRS